MLEALGRATAKIHCVSDEDTDEDLIDFQTEEAIAAAIDGSRPSSITWGSPPPRARRDHACSSTLSGVGIRPGVGDLSSFAGPHVGSAVARRLAPWRRPRPAPPAGSAELVAMISLGTDLGMGQSMEHVMRQSVIATRDLYSLNRDHIAAPIALELEPIDRGFEELEAHSAASGRVSRSPSISAARPRMRASPPRSASTKKSRSPSTGSRRAISGAAA